ncbi:hypothetical protein BS50DRAFT_638925 [Corynespora cassiicola Philippines]|uniref:Zn(2)-C6 fungal-type domain-containing protein n=1 Tax=Corynespora cassiicola Philippines TaxID=1448308 RepID=A0A2T2N832_CORCC|nr:hypothetical protein BS50DRAFT_638925 [Corynespora cassiicola Philippines]
MVGVVKSNRCGTCRRRKVKCDEAKPVCGPCRKRNRVCEAPATKIKFAEAKGLQGGFSHRPTSSGASAGGSTSPDQVAVLRIKTMGDGSSYQTWRFNASSAVANGSTATSSSDASPPRYTPSLSASDMLQLVLLDTFNHSVVGLRVSSIAQFVCEIPRRLGQSFALDDAVKCLLHCHKTMCRGDGPSPTGPGPRSYVRALHSLQVALNDKEECLSDNTLCAVAILGQVEMLGGGACDTHGMNWIRHAGGAARLIEARGPIAAKDSFAKVLLRSQRGNCFTSSVMRGQECFLDSPDWRNYSFLDDPAPDEEVAIEDMMRPMMALPALLKLVRSPDKDQRQRRLILERAEELLASLKGTADFVSVQSRATKVQSCDNNPLYPVVYDFPARRVAYLCTHLWAFSLVLNNIIIDMLPESRPDSEKDARKSHCAQLCRQLCMSYEYCEQFLPLGSMYMATPFVVACHVAPPQEKQWIVRRLGKIGEHMPFMKEHWNPMGIEIMSRYFHGKSASMVQDGADHDGYAKSWAENTRVVEKDGITDETSLSPDTQATCSSSLDWS